LVKISKIEEKFGKKFEFFFNNFENFWPNFDVDFGNLCNYHKSERKIEILRHQPKIFQKGASNFWPCSCM
jgi:hypothetical protein